MSEVFQEALFTPAAATGAPSPIVDTIIAHQPVDARLPHQLAHVSLVSQAEIWVVHAELLGRIFRHISSLSRLHVDHAPFVDRMPFEGPGCCRFNRRIKRHVVAVTAVNVPGILPGARAMHQD